MNIDTIRAQLKKAAVREPETAHPTIRMLDAQLRNFKRGNPDDREALKPEMLKSIAKIEASRHGR